MSARRPRYFLVVGLMLRWPFGVGWGPTYVDTGLRSWALSLGPIEITVSAVRDPYAW